jgi:WXG100 family type VII secretion target
MEMGEYGGDPQAMQQLGGLFNKHSANLSQMIRDLNGQMTHSNDIWKSPEANRFREAWQQAKGSFDKMAEALDKGGKDIKNTAQRLEAWGK